MLNTKKTWLQVAILAATGAASALPALPAQTVVASAVQQAMAPVTPAPALASNAASTVGSAESYAASRTGRSVVARATAYNSLGNQTDSTPHITATGTRTRPGVVALSRDMLRLFPYGTRVRITPLNGSHPYVNGRIFIVEDTMHARKTNQVDIWMPTRSQAMQWGVRSVRITAVR